jgi:hypothetical protein
VFVVCAVLVVSAVLPPGGRLGGGEQGGVGQDGDLRSHGHVGGQLCIQRNILRGLFGTGLNRRSPTATTVS